MLLITENDLIDYTENQNIKNRTFNKLKIDIIKAEAKVSDIFNKYKKNLKDYTEITTPDNIRIALIMWAEYYALKAIQVSRDKKTESFDDYSFTRYDDVEEPNVDSLLSEYLKAPSSNLIKMKMRVI